MTEWASLGGYGNVSMRSPLPVGRTDNTGALGMLVQWLARFADRRGAKMPQEEQAQQYGEDDTDRLMAEALGMIRPTDGRWTSLGMRGH